MGPHPADPLETARAKAARIVEDLRRDLAAIGESTSSTPDDEHDAEGSTIGYERARVAALLARGEEALRRLDVALDRRRTGEYGRCADCGKTIAPERLVAVPEATRCLHCARREATRGRGGPWRR